ncbi:ribonuclease E inhibitor RraB [Chitinophaga niabensis]|uniref:ribonuclease E inhibitor RraB n=1 Tax=Chitinophaga niabensis TaxID=536979 RepID=UPI0031BABC04
MLPDLDNLLILFEKIHKGGFDTSKELKWGFFFVNDNKEGLERVFDELKDHGYLMEKLESDDEEWTLQVSKVDILTAEKLHKRNIAFNALAAHCNVDLYDGWDVEKL